MNHAYQMYQNTAVQTATPQELCLQLYNGCLKFIRLAKRAMDDQQIEERHVQLTKAQAIITQFRITLDMDIAISQELDALYEFIHRKLVEANTRNDLNALEEAEGLVIELRDTWKMMMKQTTPMSVQK